MKELIGTRVTRLRMNDDNTVMAFDVVTEDGTAQIVAFETWGDCCSETWFSSLVGLDNLIGHKIIGVIERPEIHNLASVEQEEDKLYGYFLVLERMKELGEDYGGTAEIEFRNASNGYYGGECVVYEGLTAEELMGFRSIEKDF